MRFELKPKNQRFTDTELLEDLRRVARSIGSKTVTKTDYDQHGRHYRGTFAARFGSWASALERAGLVPQQPIESADLIADLRRVASELGRNYISFKEYRRLGRWSERPYVRVFGNWRAAVAAAGLGRHPNLKDRTGNDALFENLQSVWVALGRQPCYSEMERPLSKFSASTYANRFRGWRRALEEFVKWTNGERQGERPETDDVISASVSSPAVAEAPQGMRVRRSARAINLRLRFIVMRRDNFTCRHCGRSPALNPGLILHVDHVTPWEKGGETALDNLQTLCEPCNLGKSNLHPSRAG